MIRTYDVLKLVTQLLPGQVTAEGGSTIVGVLAFLMFAIAVVLAVLVTYRFVQGYMRSRTRPILLLAFGMFLLAPAPLFLRLIAGNVNIVPPAVRVLGATALEAAGLLVILAVIYRRER